jgi:phosphoglycolate phosphatase
MKMGPIPNVLLDLDGTLTDPAPGFVRCVRHALRTLGIAAPTDEHIASHIGPPLDETLAKLLGPESPEVLPEAVRLYREQYSDVGLYENSVYDGVVLALESMVANGQRLYLATSKPYVFAAKILEHFDLTRFFTGVYGCQLDGTHADKRDLLAFLIKQKELAPKDAVMVGDRFHDIRAAKSTNTKSLGVLWGYGSETELRGANADTIISSPTDLPHAVVI